MKTIHYFLLLFLLLLSACSGDEDNSYAISLQVVPPADYSLNAYDKIKVTLANKDQGTTYSAFCSPAGVASFRVEYGYYTAAVYHITNTNVVLSGRIESLSLLPGQSGAPSLVELPLSTAQSSALIIKEIYYTGCWGRLNKKYRAAQYVTLCNNSNETIYLDGFCLGMIGPITSIESPWMKHTDMLRIPINNMTWQFPGTGQEHPLLPGEETTIATNAVDHTGGEYQHANSVNLSQVDWAFWDVSLDGQVITPGVTPMKLLSKTSSEFKYTLSIVGPAFMVFKIQDTNPEAYVNDPANFEAQPQASNQNRRYLMIPKEWIMDCIDCVESIEQISFKRVPNDLDHGAAYIPDGAFSSKSLVRKKIITTDGRSVYQDTNNSSEDMAVSDPTLKNKI